MAPLPPPYFLSRQKQSKSIGNLCPRWDTYIADDVEDPKFIILYPKGLHSFIHQNSIPFVIAQFNIYKKNKLFHFVHP
jgi:hypothetical protein